MSKKSCFRGSFPQQHGKCSQALLKFASKKFKHIHQSLPKKLCSKKSLLMACDFLGLLVNTLATDEKYPLLNREILAIPIQMHLSQKEKYFLSFLLQF